MRVMVNDQLKIRNVPDISAKTFCLNHTTGNISNMNHKFDQKSYNSSDTESLHSNIDSQYDIQSLNESFHSEDIIYDETYKPTLIIEILEKKLNMGVKYQEGIMIHDNKQELIKINKKAEKEHKVKFTVRPSIHEDNHNNNKEQFKSVFPLKIIS